MKRGASDKPTYDWRKPYAPYPGQAKLMTELCELFKSGGLGVFQSPTGTGKSMAVCASALGFFNETKTRGDTFPKWLSTQLSNNSDVSAAKERRRNRLSSSKEDYDLADEEEDCVFVYVARTHTQISQFVLEARSAGFLVDGFGVALASRRKLCAVNEVKTSSSPYESCIELGAKCRYSRSSGRAVDELLLNELLPIEEAFDVLLTKKACPYYSCKNSVKAAKFVVCPYSVLLSSSTRKTLKLDLKNAHVVVDEAHNLVKALNDQRTVDLPTEELDLMVLEASAYLKRYSDASAKTTYLLKLLKSVCVRLGKSKRLKNSALVMEDYLSKVDLTKVNLFELCAGLKESNLVNKMRTVAAKVRNSKRSESSLSRVLPFLRALTERDADGRVFVLNDSLIYEHMNPAIAFREVIDSAKSVALLGGTMGDRVTLERRVLGLNKKFDLWSVQGHVVDDKRFLGFVVKGVKLTYANRNDETYAVVGRALLRIRRSVPVGGMVVFMPSYAVCAAVSSNLNYPHVFVDAKHTDDVFKRYESAIESKPILLAVCGGSLSEGIDFKDDLCRCVVMAGVPFANPRDLRIKAKMDFLNQTFGSNAGSDWFESSAYASVAQSVGRAVRHSEDYAAVVFLDERYNSRALKRLPEWISSKTLATPQTAERVCDGLTKFFAALEDFERRAPTTLKRAFA